MGCTFCNQGWELEPQEVEDAMKDVSIAFMHKYGLLVLAGIAILLGIVLSMLDKFGVI